ncbi:MAG: hypothetical protein KJ646_02590 [Nanoarchaeota archaeon]|nr:hypothetical protein [Nanoarchaeota archaeon]MBU4116453.1 hypothetical protein [Nanoarchaeota archaeon]
MGKGMEKNSVNENMLQATISFAIFAILIIGGGAYFVFNKPLIGPVFLGLSLVGLIFLKFFKIKIRSVYPDIIFGIVDNGILLFGVILGGTYAGIGGAIIGGAAGNAITDGLGGLSEGYMAEILRKKRIKNERTSLSTMIGKMMGCLIGAGVGLSLIWLISLF